MAMTHLGNPNNPKVAACGAIDGELVLPLSPFDLVTLRIECTMCAAIFLRDANEGNPFEPPETPNERARRVGRMIRENVDRRLGVTKAPE